MSRPRLQCRVLVDVDGTIATVDSTDAQLDRFALPAWHAIESVWKFDEIGSRECLMRPIDLIRATPDAAPAFLRVFVGDGRLDFCVAEQADFVRAKKTLIDHARLQDLLSTAFTSFADAGRHARSALH